jgi:hypothetical protein
MTTGLILILLLGATAPADDATPSQAPTDEAPAQAATTNSEAKASTDADADANANDRDTEPAATPLDPAAPAAPKLHTLRKSRRTGRELDPCANPTRADDPRCQNTAENRVLTPPPDLPAPLGLRSRLVASSLGLVAGFGTGLFYAGDHVQGVVLAATDVLLWGGFAWALAAFNQLVIRNDFKSGVSLARGDRAFTEQENTLWATTWVMLSLCIASHLYQGVMGVLAAGWTNERLSGFAIVPLDEGGAFSLALSF